ncbi:TetR/AcrR family transcriptional regulator [Bacteroidales bacterium]|nr:TetR/AcrR family transcriptional regulator [Bacteroidales bacterium]
MGDKDLNTENKVLEAAQEIFILKGKSGARMQEIANKAGINKALLHYYYRSKDKLFEAVFQTVIKKLLIPKIIKLIESEQDVFSIIRTFVDFYVSLLIKNRYIPRFVIEEINNNPSRLSDTFVKNEIPLQAILQRFEEAMEQGLIRKIDPRQIIVNMIAMCIFPFIATPMLQPVLFDNKKRDFDAFLKQRKTEVADFIINSIKL